MTHHHSLATAQCPACGKKKLASMGTFPDRDSIICKACGWERHLPLHEQFAAACENCKKSLGKHARYRTDAAPIIHCADCEDSAPELATIRHESKCSGGCGNLVGYVDVARGEVPEGLHKHLTCLACDSKFASKG